MTDYLAIALLHHSEGVAVNESLEVTPSRHLDLGQLHLAARINISEWRNNKQSKQYISFIKGKGGKKVSDYFRDFIGCQEGVDSPSETRTPAEGLQRLRRKRGHGRGTGPRENRDAGRLRHLAGAHRRADDPRRALRTDGRPATTGVLRLHPQQGLRPVAGNPGGQAHPQPVPSLHRPRRRPVDQLRGAPAGLKGGVRRRARHAHHPPSCRPS
ncbi:nucleoid-associated protein NdpA [Pseudomonas aeruginosa]|nr:nucleoid-associated protein NdpA [Pseudomonas aeruginosa]